MWGMSPKNPAQAQGTLALGAFGSGFAGSFSKGMVLDGTAEKFSEKVE